MVRKINNHVSYILAANDYYFTYQYDHLEAAPPSTTSTMGV